MTPADERRALESLFADVAVLKVGIQYGAEDRARIREELLSIEKRIIARLTEIDSHITGVDRECKDFRESAAVEWDKYRAVIAGLQSEISTLTGAVGSSERVKDRRMTTTVAWIGGVFLLAGSVVQTIATLAG